MLNSTQWISCLCLSPTFEGWGQSLKECHVWFRWPEVSITGRGRRPPVFWVHLSVFGGLWFFHCLLMFPTSFSDCTYHLPMSGKCRRGCRAPMVPGIVHVAFFWCFWLPRSSNVCSVFPFSYLSTCSAARCMWHPGSHFWHFSVYLVLLVHV